jgi:hypothetical protein
MHVFPIVCDIHCKCAWGWLKDHELPGKIKNWTFELSTTLEMSKFLLYFSDSF